MLERAGVGEPSCSDLASEGYTFLFPKINFLSETIMSANQADFVKVQVGFRNCFSVGKNGRSGGLMILWDDVWDVVVKSYFASHIDVVISSSIGN